MKSAGGQRPKPIIESRELAASGSPARSSLVAGQPLLSGPVRSGRGGVTIPSITGRIAVVAPIIIKGERYRYIAREG